MANTILLKRSSTSDDVPVAGDLAYGELALNYADGNLFYKNSADSVVVLASNKTLTLSGNITAGNVTTAGTTTTVDLTATGTVDLGAVGNVTITGGSSGQAIVTDGSGGLSFSSVSQTFPMYIHVVERDDTTTSVGLQFPVNGSVRKYEVYTQDGTAVGLDTYSS